MGVKILDSSPTLKSIVKRYASVQAHSLIDWENRIDPALYELGKMPGVKKTKVLLDEKRISFCGNDAGFYDFLKEKGREDFFTESRIFLYVYSGLHDLGLLRRLKEFPDETPRA